MGIQEIFLTLSLISPIVILAIFSYRKNPIYFTIAFVAAFYIGHSFYETYLSLDLYDFIAPKQIKVRAIELNRDIVFSNAIKSVGLSFIYTLLLAGLFWNIPRAKSKPKVGFRLFFRSSLFYFILFIGTLIDILLALMLGFEYWKISITSLFLAPIFFIIAIYLKDPPPKDSYINSSKSTLILAILIISFWLIMRFL